MMMMMMMTYLNVNCLFAVPGVSEFASTVCYKLLTKCIVTLMHIIWRVKGKGKL